MQTRAGHLIFQPQGYKAFIPTPLPPIPPINIDHELGQLISDAAFGLGKLDFFGDSIPDIDTFVFLFQRKEALLSSQIEGTQCTLEDILDPTRLGNKGLAPDIKEVSNSAG